MDESRHAGAGGGAHRGSGAVDVHALHRARVLDAQRVDAGHVVGERAAVHAAGEHVVVVALATDDLDAAPRQGRRAGVGARQRDDLVAAREQPAHERRADHAGAPGDEYASYERSAAENWTM